MRGEKFTFAFSMVLVMGAWGATEVAAQVDVDPTGPTCVESDDTSSIYRATVTTNYNFDFWLRVYHNGVLKHESTVSYLNDGPSVLVRRSVSHTGWGMATGDSLDYLGRATITEAPYHGVYSEKHWVKTVSAPGTCLLPVPLQNEVADPAYAIREETV